MFDSSRALLTMMLFPSQTAAEIQQKLLSGVDFVEPVRVRPFELPLSGCPSLLPVLPIDHQSLLGGVAIRPAGWQTEPWVDAWISADVAETAYSERRAMGAV